MPTRRSFLTGIAAAAIPAPLANKCLSVAAEGPIPSSVWAAHNAALAQAMRQTEEIFAANIFNKPFLYTPSVAG